MIVLCKLPLWYKEALTPAFYVPAFAFHKCLIQATPPQGPTNLSGRHHILLELLSSFVLDFCVASSNCILCSLPCHCHKEAGWPGRNTSSFMVKFYLHYLLMAL